MIGCPFVPVRGRRHHDLSMGNLLVQASCSAEKDKTAARQLGCGVFHQPDGNGSSDIGFVERKPLPVFFDQVNGGLSRGAPECGNLPAGILLRNHFFDLMGKGNDAGVHDRCVFFFPGCDDGRGKIIKRIRDHRAFLPHSLYCMKFPFLTNPKSEYSSIPMSEAVIWTAPHPCFLASSMTNERSFLAIPCLLYS